MHHLEKTIPWKKKKYFEHTLPLLVGSRRAQWNCVFCRAFAVVTYSHMYIKVFITKSTPWFTMSPNGFCTYDFIRLSHHRGGILARSPLQRCFSSLRVEVICLCTDCITACWTLGHCNISTLSFSAILSQIYCCVWDHRAFAWPDLGESFTAGLTFEYFGIQRSWLTHWLQGTQVLLLQKKPKSSPLPHRADGL